MTRFGKIPPLWQILKNILGKVFNSIWHNLYAFGQIFSAVNGPILKTQSGHLVTLVVHKMGRMTDCGFSRKVYSPLIIIERDFVDVV